ncbi:pollen-specific leucine-rich repeat extensin-like protein 3 [Iris pallida]|uniref:Pollen-specific leucine-rich repeat extensin-like protein 3 n=1 Tax=Iris pallida TaxID=29817 RepID=A0AAX6HER9_IRIPA|nr:pollen-specific leucine-rich repeat extensin-like protein 3 [Iris pallida]
MLRRVLSRGHAPPCAGGRAPPSSIRQRYGCQYPGQPLPRRNFLRRACAQGFASDFLRLGRLPIKHPIA